MIIILLFSNVQIMSLSAQGIQFPKLKCSGYYIIVYVLKVSLLCWQQVCKRSSASSSSSSNKSQPDCRDVLACG